MSDFLIHIPDHDLPNLVALYKEKVPWAPLMTCFVQSTMRWKKLPRFKEAVRFLSPRSCWKEDGTVIVIIRWSTSQDIVVFTLEDQCVNLYKGLTQTRLIEYEEGVTTVFYNVHERHVSMIQKFMQEREISGRVFANIWCITYAIAPTEAKKFTIECPPEAYIRKLDPSFAKQINDVWPHRFPNSERYIETYIEITGGYGLFLKSTDQMVAWIIRHPFGHLSMLQTDEELD